MNRFHETSGLYQTSDIIRNVNLEKVSVELGKGQTLMDWVHSTLRAMLPGSDVGEVLPLFNQTENEFFIHVSGPEGEDLAKFVITPSAYEMEEGAILGRLNPVAKGPVVGRIEGEVGQGELELAAKREELPELP